MRDLDDLEVVVITQRRRRPLDDLRLGQSVTRRATTATSSGAVVRNQPTELSTWSTRPPAPGRRARRAAAAGAPRRTPRRGAAPRAPRRCAAPGRRRGRGPRRHADHRVGGRAEQHPRRPDVAGRGAETAPACSDRRSRSRRRHRAPPAKSRTIAAVRSRWSPLRERSTSCVLRRSSASSGDMSLASARRVCRAIPVSPAASTPRPATSPMTTMSEPSVATKTS